MLKRRVMTLPDPIQLVLKRVYRIILQFQQLSPFLILRRRQYRRQKFRKVAREGIKLTGATFGYDKYHGLYQNLYGLEEKSGKKRHVRSTQERWHLISPHLPMGGSALDVGCQYGWFVFKMADRGLLSLGIERDERDVRMAQWLTIYNSSDLAAFLRLDLNPETVRLLPTVDVILCLSVFHHWVIENDIAHAERVMRGLAERCRGRIFFETGQPDEHHRSWSKRMNFMGDSAEAWTDRFLRSLGFDDCVLLGTTPAPRGQGVRCLMMASKQDLPVNGTSHRLQMNATSSDRSRHDPADPADLDAQGF